MLIRVMNSYLGYFELKVVVLFQEKFDSMHYVAIFCVGMVFGVCRLLDDMHLNSYLFAVKDWLSGV